MRCRIRSGNLLFSLCCGILISLSYHLTSAFPPLPPDGQIYTLFGGYGLAPSLVAVFTACLICFVREYSRSVPVPAKVGLMGISVLFGLMNVSGENVAYLGKLMIGKSFGWSLVFFLCVLGFSVFFWHAAVLVLSFFSRLCEKDGDPASPEQIKTWFRICFFAIFLCWIIWILAYYPATVDYDAQWQICSFLGLRERSSHQPWFSSCLIGLFYKAGKALGSDNLGMFLYILFRVLVMALIYARSLAYLLQSGIRKGFVVLVLLYFALTPVWGAYAKQPFKDTFTCALFCWYILRTVILLRPVADGTAPGASACLLYSVSGLLVSLFRNNYVYVFLIMTVIIVFFFLRRRVKILCALCLMLGPVVYFGYQTVITDCFGVAPAPTREALSLPFQQTARTVKYHADTISPQERADISRVLDYDSLSERYDPVISDPVKATADLNASKADYLAYFRAWGALFLKHPRTYLEATLAGTYGYYAFTMDGFPSGGLGNCGMVILDDINRDHGAHYDEYFDFRYLEPLQGVRNALQLYWRVWHQMPVLSLTDTIPLYFWILVLILFYLLTAHRGLLILPSCAVFLAVLTVIASPVNGSFRYFAPIAASIPVLFSCFGGPGQDVFALKEHGISCDSKA